MDIIKYLVECVCHVTKAAQPAMEIFPPSVTLAQAISNYSRTVVYCDVQWATSSWTNGASNALIDVLSAGIMIMSACAVRKAMLDGILVATCPVATVASKCQARGSVRSVIVTARRVLVSMRTNACPVITGCFFISQCVSKNALQGISQKHQRLCATTVQKTASPVLVSFLLSRMSSVLSYFNFFYFQADMTLILICEMSGLIRGKMVSLQTRKAAFYLLLCDSELYSSFCWLKAISCLVFVLPFDVTLNCFFRNVCFSAKKV